MDRAVHVNSHNIKQSSVQISYIKHVLESNSTTKYQYVEGLFKQFLKTSPFVDLWKYYLRYVQYVSYYFFHGVKSV
jgi:hypothetical protein